MDMVKHKQFGMGEVVSKEVVGEYTCITARFDAGREMRFVLPQSFETGAVEALGALKDEVDRAIAARKAPPADAAPVRTPGVSAGKTSAKTMPTGPVASAFEDYLIQAGYRVESDSGKPSTVRAYVDAVDAVRTEEGMSWDGLKANISAVVPRYDLGGAKELIGAKRHKTVINGLKRFAEFAGKP